MEIFGVQLERSDRNAVIYVNETTQYPAGRYINRYEALLGILLLAVHLENR